MPPSRSPVQLDALAPAPVSMSTSRSKLPPPPPPPPDGGPGRLELGDSVAAAARGDRRSWEALYRRFYPDVYRHVTFLTHDPVVAEDLCQEIFALAMLRLDKLEDLESFPGWLHGIARHLVYKHWRSSGRRHRHHEQFSREQLQHGPHDEVESKHLDRQRAQALRDVLETIPDHLREAYVAMDIQQIPPDTAAGQLGITRGNLAVRASRARTRIRTELRRRGWLERSD